MGWHLTCGSGCNAVREGSDETSTLSISASGSGCYRLPRNSTPKTPAESTNVSSLRVGNPLMATNPLSTRHQRFAYARLSQPCLPGSCPDFSATFTTIAFDDSSLRWLEINT